MRHEARALLDLPFHGRHVCAIEPGIERLVRGRLGGKQKMRTDCVHRLARCLPRGQIIAEVDRLQVRIPGSVRCQPAMRGTGFAILLLGTVLRGVVSKTRLRHDELRLERQRTVMAGCDERGRDHGVKMLGFAVGTRPAGAAGAVELLGAEVLGAVQRRACLKYL